MWLMFAYDLDTKKYDTLLHKTYLIAAGKTHEWIDIYIIVTIINTLPHDSLQIKRSNLVDFLYAQIFVVGISIKTWIYYGHNYWFINLAISIWKGSHWVCITKNQILRNWVWYRLHTLHTINIIKSNRWKCHYVSVETIQTVDLLKNDQFRWYE